MKRLITAAIIMMSCAGRDVPGSGPVITTSHPELVLPFLQAIDYAGDRLQEYGLADPALVMDVTLLDGFTFDDFEGSGTDNPLWGKNRLVITPKGPRCMITLALRVVPEEVVPSGTSLVHEAAHCSLDWSLRPDHDHTMQDVWGADGIVKTINKELSSQGL